MWDLFQLSGYCVQAACESWMSPTDHYISKKVTSVCESLELLLPNSIHNDNNMFVPAQRNGTITSLNWQHEGVNALQAEETYVIY